MYRVCMYCHHYVNPNNTRRPITWDGYTIASHVVCTDPSCRKKFYDDMSTTEAEVEGLKEQ